MPNAQNKMPIRTHCEGAEEAEAAEAGKGQPRQLPGELQQNTFSKCRATINASWWQLNAWQGFASPSPCSLLLLLLLVSPQATRSHSAVAATNNAQIWRNATHRRNRLPIHFNSLCFDLFITCRWKLKLHFASGFLLSLPLSLPLLPRPLPHLFSLCLASCSAYSLSLSLALSRCFTVIGAIAPGNHCQQLMKAIVGVAAF